MFQTILDLLLKAGTRWCHPVNQVCCGCRVSFGVRCILFAHFVFSALMVAQTFLMVFFPNVDSLFSQNMSIGCVFFGYSLTSLTFIAGAVYGVEKKQEAFVRVYQYFLAASLSVVCGVCVYMFVTFASCSTLPALLSAHGRSYACGVVRISSIIFSSLVIGLSSYIVFVVWSHCEDIMSGAHPDFADLVVDEDLKEERRAKAILGRDWQNHHMHQGGAASGLLAAVNQLSMDMQHLSQQAHKNYGTEDIEGGSNALFGGTKHEMRFPPPSPLLKAPQRSWF